MWHLLTTSVLCIMFSAPIFAEGPSARVSDLAWMTGHYKGTMGNGSLEENWANPDGSSIAALVRSTAAGKTDMIEIIVIEEEGDSLTLRLKQWNPGMQERDPGFQVMELIEIGTKRVLFKNTGTVGLQQLGYSLDGDQFTISVKTAQGGIDIPLTRQMTH